MTAVPADDWASTLGDLAADGYDHLDFLTAVDRIDRIEVVAHVLDPRRMGRMLVTTSVTNAHPHLATATASHPAAAWHERETSEMFGLVFDGLADSRPLLLRTAPDRPPLRKSTPLAERVATPWPGAPDPVASAGDRARRRQLPPGVREEWQETS